MASQQPPTRAWFRLPSMTRPTAPAPAPVPLAQTQPPASRPMPPFVRPTFRPPVAHPQQTQPQAPAPPPTPPVAAASPATASPPTPPVAAPPPATTSVLSSPIIKVSASSSSLPSSPAAKPSPKSTIPPVESFSSVSLSPKPKTSFSLPTSRAYASKESPVPSAAYTSSVPPPHNIKVLSASSSSLPTSPAPKVMSPLAPPSHISATTTIAVTARAATPTSSPKAKNPPLSPEVKPVSTPPSPLVIPPAQIKFDNKAETKIPAESEQKTILMQKTFEEPKVMPNTSKDHKGFYKKYSESEDFGKRVITIAGENRGAVMELSPSRKNLAIAGNHHSLHKKGNSIALISDDEQSERDGNEEGRSKMKDKTHKMVAMVSPLKTAIINSNVQGVNNSILCNSSFTHRDPGVHLTLSGGRGAYLKE